MDLSRIQVQIVCQPAAKALRFRYECEGRSAGSLPGADSTQEKKTYPKIQIVGYTGRAVVVVSCVTIDPPHRPHPHNLVGKEGCKKGVCTLEISNEDMTCEFSNLGIQCVKKKEIESSLRIREEIRVDPFRTGFAHKNQPGSIDLNSVRLCFQVFLEGPEKGQFKIPLKAVVSEPIFDKKAINDLTIMKLSDCTSPVLGGKEVILLCDKVSKDDIEIRFFEEQNGDVVWEAYGDFQPSDVHKQFAISFRTPQYHNLEIESPSRVFIQLRCPSKDSTSAPRPFDYLPLSSGKYLSKKRKFDENFFLTMNGGGIGLQQISNSIENETEKQPSPNKTVDNLENLLSNEDAYKCLNDLLVEQPDLVYTDLAELKNFAPNAEEYYDEENQVDIQSQLINNNNNETDIDAALGINNAENECIIIQQEQTPQQQFDNFINNNQNNMMTPVATAAPIVEQMDCTISPIQELQPLIMKTLEGAQNNGEYSSFELAMKNPVEPPPPRPPKSPILSQIPGPIPPLPPKRSEVKIKKKSGGGGGILSFFSPKSKVEKQQKNQQEQQQTKRYEPPIEIPLSTPSSTSAQNLNQNISPSKNINTNNEKPKFHPENATKEISMIEKQLEIDTENYELYLKDAPKATASEFEDYVDIINNN